MKEIIDNLDGIVRIVFSNSKNTLYKKIVVTNINNKYFVESFTDTQAFHQNHTANTIADFLREVINSGNYSQTNVYYQNYSLQYKVSKKGKVLVSKNKVETKQVTSQNKKKQYLINEYDDVPILRELGIFTKENKIVASKQDKFRQINRFVEIINDRLKNYQGDSISIVDFGCGKSYLTFVAYYYFEKIKNIKVKIIGYDLKTEVVNNCNNLAEKYNYHNLHFEVRDVTHDKLTTDKIDMVISLHACDIATDYALHFAITNNVKYIFSVPCCQHEINATISKGQGDYDLFLNKGLFKERFSALLTDVYRTEILENLGYKVDVLEFVDFSHSPKNIMLRCEKTPQTPLNCHQLDTLCQKYGFSQKLLELVEEI